MVTSGWTQNSWNTALNLTTNQLEDSPHTVDDNKDSERFPNDSPFKTEQNFGSWFLDKSSLSL